MLPPILLSNGTIVDVLVRDIDVDVIGTRPDGLLALYEFVVEELTKKEYKQVTVSHAEFKNTAIILRVSMIPALKEGRPVEPLLGDIDQAVRLFIDQTLALRGLPPSSRWAEQRPAIDPAHQGKDALHALKAYTIADAGVLLDHIAQYQGELDANYEEPPL